MIKHHRQPPNKTSTIIEARVELTTMANCHKAITEFFGLIPTNKARLVSSIIEAFEMIARQNDWIKDPIYDNYDALNYLIKNGLSKIDRRREDKELVEQALSEKPIKFRKIDIKEEKRISDIAEKINLDEIMTNISRHENK